MRSVRGTARWLMAIAHGATVRHTARDLFCAAGALMHDGCVIDWGCRSGVTAVSVLPAVAPRST
jgi:hypothetical protein